MSTPTKNYPSRSAQRCRTEMRQMIDRMKLLDEQQADIAQIAASAAPVKDAASWPSNIGELADKIYREENQDLRSFESPVRDRDRQLVLAGLPPGVEVQRNDPRYTQ